MSLGDKKHCLGIYFKVIKFCLTNASSWHTWEACLSPKLSCGHRRKWDPSDFTLLVNYILIDQRLGQGSGHHTGRTNC